MSPELNSRLQAIRAKLIGGDISADDEASILRAKIAKRDGAGGYKQNVMEMKARLGEIELMAGIV